MSSDRAGQPPLRVIASPDPPPRPRAPDTTDQPSAEVRGINIHAAQLVDDQDRHRVERRCKYVTRPPVAQDRLERRADGKLPLSPKRAWRAGTRALVFEPADIIPRLVVAVPPALLAPTRVIRRALEPLVAPASRRASAAGRCDDEPGPAPKAATMSSCERWPTEYVMKLESSPLRDLLRAIAI
ncbi:MAG: transposase [Polyangiaceae bacterium]|nr:transposase [Polyangiaceae bacterium]